MSTRRYLAMLSMLAALLLGLTGCFYITVPSPGTSTPANAPSSSTTPATTPTAPSGKLKLPIIANPNLPIITKPLLPSTPTPIPTPIPLPIPSITVPFAVVGLTAQVDAPSYTGLCPKTFNFIGTITTNGPGTVTYRWERSDGATDPVQSATFSAAALQTVTTSWLHITKLNGATFKGWERLHVLTPNDSLSNQASFTLTCS